MFLDRSFLLRTYVSVYGPCTPCKATASKSDYLKQVLRF